MRANRLRWFGDVMRRNKSKAVRIEIEVYAPSKEDRQRSEWM